MKIHFQGGPLKMYIEDMPKDKLSDVMKLRFYNKVHVYKRIISNPYYYNYVKTEKI